MGAKFNSFMFNPFDRIGGWKALLWGVGAVALGAFMKAFLDFWEFPFLTYVSQNKWYWYFLEDMSVILITALVYYLLSDLFTKSNLKPRAIDIIGNFTFAMIPCYATTLLMFLYSTTDITHVLKIFGFFLLIIVFLGSYILATIWMYQALKVSFNLKGATLIWIFVVGLILTTLIWFGIMSFLGLSPIKENIDIPLYPLK